MVRMQNTANVENTENEANTVKAAALIRGGANAGSISSTFSTER